MKKIIAVVSVFALIALGTSAFASEGWVGGDVYTKIKVKIHNDAKVDNDVSTVANTGENSADADVDGVGAGSQRAKGGRIDTGEAAAWSGVLVGVNANDVLIDTSGCGCERDGDTTTKIKVDLKNKAKVDNDVSTVANTGGNSADADVDGVGTGSQRAKGGKITTGNADAMSEVGVIANTTVVTITTN